MKRVLFVCVENSCRSQMAEGLARKLGTGIVEAYSAGSRPSGIVNLQAVESMKEIGIDISLQRSKGFDVLLHKEFDVVVTLGCNDTCPLAPAGLHISWQIPDPKGKGPQAFCQARDLIEANLRALLREFSETAKK
jgi:arsenate reductase